MTTDKNGEITFPKWFVWLAGLAVPTVGTWMTFVSVTLWDMKATVQTGLAVQEQRYVEMTRRVNNLEAQRDRTQ